LSPIFGIFGITMATSISELFSSTLLLLSIKKSYPYLNIKQFLIYLGYLFIGLLISILFVFYFRQVLSDLSSFFRLVILTFTTFLIYFISIIPLIRLLYRKSQSFMIKEI
jgi:putative peptidoglycan lipid II flippase